MRNELREMGAANHPQRACAHACGAVFMVASITKQSKTKQNRNKNKTTTKTDKQTQKHVHVLSAQGRESKNHKRLQHTCNMHCTVHIESASKTLKLKILLTIAHFTNETMNDALCSYVSGRILVFDLIFGCSG